LTPPAQSSSLSWLWNLFKGSQKSTSIAIPKYPNSPDEVSLSQALQYGRPATALSVHHLISIPRIGKWLAATQRVHS
jgi:hypothetical protein